MTNARLDPQKTEDQSELEKLKAERNRLMREAEKAAYQYCCAVDVGIEREKAFEIYENLRNAGRVYAH